MKKKKKPKKQRKIIPLNTKTLGNDITKYPYVEIEWLDIEGDAGWSSTKQLNLEQLPTCVSKGYLLSQKNGITRIFTDYIKLQQNVLCLLIFLVIFISHFIIK